MAGVGDLDVKLCRGSKEGRATAGSSIEVQGQDAGGAWRYHLIACV